MSIPVKIGDLSAAVGSYGSAYLLTVGDGRVKAVTVDPYVVDGVVMIEGGSRGSSANLADNPSATLVFPPAEPQGYTFLVDGSAEAVEQGFRFVPDSAVLHRPGSHSGGPPAPSFAGEQTGCDNDCRPV